MNNFKSTALGLVKWVGLIALSLCHVEMVPERFETGNQKYQANQFYLASQRPLACFYHLPAARSY